MLRVGVVQIIGHTGMVSPSPQRPDQRRGQSSGTPRTRADQRRGERAVRAGSARTSGAHSASSPDELPTEPAEQPAAYAGLIGMGLARKLVAVAVVLGILAFPFVSSLRVYYRQQEQAAQARAQIAESQGKIAELKDEITRWNDPDYVKAQARSRLGWVVPGETGYKVIGPDGKPLGGGAQIQTQSTTPAGEQSPMWWDTMIGSVTTADNPAPAEPSAPATITPPPQTPTPTPKR